MTFSALKALAISLAAKHVTKAFPLVSCRLVVSTIRYCKVVEVRLNELKLKNVLLMTVLSSRPASNLTQPGPARDL